MEENNELLLIFDLDGTIFRTKETIFPAIKEVLNEIGLEDDIEGSIGSLIGEKTSEFCEKVKPKGIEMDEFIEKLWKKEKEFIDKSGSLYEGIGKVLDECRSRDIQMVLCSNANRDYIEYVLDRFGLNDHFVEILSGSEFDDKRKAVENIVREYEGDPAVLIGDREIDKNAAAENGVIFLGALYGYGREEIEGEYFAIKDPKEILGHINQLEIFTAIENHYNSIDEDKIDTIGVNGIDNSGKTTFAKSLSEYLDARGYESKVISIDDFHNPKDIRGKGENPVDAYYENAFDTERLIEEILEPIRNNQEVHKVLEILNLKTDIYDLKKEYHVNRNDIVIMEGVLLYKEPLDRYIDYKIYLNINFDTMMKRARERDEERFDENVVKRYKEKYIPIQKKYIEEDNPKLKSDMIIDNNDFDKPEIIKISG